MATEGGMNHGSVSFEINFPQITQICSQITQTDYF
jgi:hypothetical protein